MVDTLYKFSSKGKLQVWSAVTQGADIIATHGEHNGKMQESKTTAKAKNTGKANATTPEEQAEIQRIALYEKQVKNKHYRYSVEEAQELADNCSIPRKIHNFKDHGHKMTYPCYLSVKKNGSRGCVINGNLFSKAGLKEDLKVQHIADALKLLGDVKLDSEVYVHGLSLQRIRKCWTKPVRSDKEIAKLHKELAEEGRELYNPNEDAKTLQLHVFDIPVEGVPFPERIQMMIELETKVIELGLDHIIKFIYPVVIQSEEEGLALIDAAVKNGYEGGVFYAMDDMMEFGTRSYTTLKSKPRYDAEAYVEEVSEDKKGNAVLHLRTSDKMDRVKFKTVMKVKRRDGQEYPKDLRSITHECLGKWITYSYEELSDKGVPTKPVGEIVRACDATGEPLE